MTRIAIDPVTRVNGPLRIEAEVAGGVVIDAWSSGTMFRGIELVLHGRDPRDAWLLAQRICGVCNGVHGLASVRAVERALGVTIPPNARLVRNLLAGSQLVASHVTSFYQMHSLDWVDLASAARADPAAAWNLARSVSDRDLSGDASFRAARDRWAAHLASAQPDAFADGGDSRAYALAPAANLVLATHYLEALDWRRSMTRLATFLGGKSPHPQTFVVGGMALAAPWGGPTRPLAQEHPQQVGRSAPAALSAKGLAELAGLVADARDFVSQVYLPDVLTLAGAYRDWSGLGDGIGHYLSYGEFPEDDTDAPTLLLPRGRIMDRDLTAVRAVDQVGVGETVARSHYHYAGDDADLLHPFDGQTDPAYAGPPAPVTTLERADRYSWLKAPRYQDDPMEVGPLARMLVGHAAGTGPVHAALVPVLARLGIGPEALMSTLGRTVARAVEAQVVADRLAGWLTELGENLSAGDLALADLGAWDPATWPAEAQGWSLGESPRGAIGHWVSIRDRRIADYQVVDASTWNASPRDGRGRRGALEQALVGTPVTDPDHPVEILRTVHSFDPCTACAVHAYAPDAAPPIQVRVVEGDVA